MANKRIYLSPPHMTGKEMNYIQDAFDSNWIAPLGPHVDAFEKEMADYVGCKGALALSSGTAALHLGLKLLSIQPGDTVFCPSLTFSATVNPVIYEGAVPVFIDSDRETWNMSPSALRRAFEEAEKNGKLPKAVITVDLYGQSANYGPIVDLCNSYNVPVLEDAAEALGATYDGKKCGTLGKLGVLSFNGNKIITTSGGGMLVSDDLEMLSKARFWATQARDPAPHYQHSEIGYNYRMSNILAAIGRAQLEVIEERVAARRRIFETYGNSLGSIPGISFMPEASFGRANRWLTVMVVDPQTGVTPADIMKALQEENIESRPVWKPMHLQPVFEKYAYFPHQEDETVSDELFANGICLPSGSSLTEEEQVHVIEIILDTLRQR
jgi:pyridoxal phosphate-dependent aminotransferase EpsN